MAVHDFLRLCCASEELVTNMAKSNWAAASFDVLKQVFECLPEWSRGHGASKLPQYLLVCKHWVAPARRWLHDACIVAMLIGFTVTDLFSGSAT